MMPIKNKILAILLAMSFNAFAAAWTGSNSEPENMKKIDGKTFYVITTADELAWFAAQVNAGQTTINAVLGKNIIFGSSENSLCSKNWTPIGKDSSHMYSGIFDGSSYTIFGLYSRQAKFSGLFGVIGENAIVKNITMASSKVQITTHNGAVGSVAGVNNGLITNCVNQGLVEFPLIFGGSDGITGFAGGIVGYNSGRITYSKNQNLLTYENGSDVKVSALYFGGICGYNKGEISRCENNGSISLKIKVEETFFSISLLGCVAGIVGKNEGSISFSKNIKSISASLVRKDLHSSLGTSTYVGGIAALNYGQIKDCFNMEAYSAVEQDTYSVETSGKVGGIFAFNDAKKGLIKSSFDVRGLKYYLNKSAVSSTAENMKRDQFAWILNTLNGSTGNSGAWTRDPNGYPSFANDDSLAICKIVFNDDGATSNRYTNYKGLVTFPENPEPAEGFVFTGWYNASDVRVKPTTVFSADQTVNAVYADAGDVFWTINFYNSDLKTTLLETKSYQHGSIVTYEGETPTRETTAQYTYTFKGWDVELTNAVEDFDYHAVYDSTVRSYKISFNDYNGSLIENGMFEYGKIPSCSKTLTRAATAEWKYSHKGWKPALDYVTGEATYVATYDSSKVEYKVIFLNGTTVIDEQMVPYGKSAIAPTNVTRDGYKFVGWNTTFSKITENLTVKALFEELTTYIVKVVGLNGEKIDSVKVEENGIYILPAAPKEEGYTFDAYYNGNKKVGAAGIEISITENITITAKYSKNPESSSSSAPKSSSSSAPKSSSSVKSSSSNGDSQVVVEGELEQTVSPGAYIDPIIFKKVKKYNRNSSHISFLQTLPAQGSDELAIVGLVPESYKAGVYTESWTINGSIYTVKLTIVSNSSSSSAKSSSSSAKTSIAMKNIMPQFNVTVGFHSVQISGAKVGASYALLDMQGRVLRKGRIESANFNIVVLNAGRYFVRIGNQIRNVNVK